MNIKIQIIPLLLPRSIDPFHVTKAIYCIFFSYSGMSSLFSTINWTKKFWQTFLFYLSLEIKVWGQDNSFFESSRFKYTNQRHRNDFFFSKKEKTVRRSKAKEEGKKVLDNSSIRQRYSEFFAFLRTIFGVFFHILLTRYCEGLIA